MKKILSAVLVLLAGAVFGGPVTPYFTATPPVIDGKLDMAQLMEQMSKEN